MIFDEVITLVMGLGMALVIAGVVLVEFGSDLATRSHRGSRLMEWVYLSGAIACEVTATVALRAATTGRKAWYVVVTVGYLASFVFLSLTLDAGLGLGVAYGIWAAVGVALTAIASRVFFKEPLTILMAIGIALIMGGVFLIELGGTH